MGLFVVNEPLKTNTKGVLPPRVIEMARLGESAISIIGKIGCVSLKNTKEFQ
jgi:hypothetical protein